MPPGELKLNGRGSEDVAVVVAEVVESERANVFQGLPSVLLCRNEICRNLHVGVHLCARDSPLTVTRYLGSCSSPRGPQARLIIRDSPDVSFLGPALLSHGLPPGYLKQVKASDLARVLVWIKYPLD